jgi:DNA-binding MarR family transcriptional regulator
MPNWRLRGGIFARRIETVHMHDYLQDMDDEFDLCFVLNSRMAARAVTRRADRKLRAHGITSAQFTIMGALLRGPGRSVTQVAEAIAMDRSTLSRNLALLERKGLVVSRPAERGNGRLGALTEAGQALVQAVLPTWREQQAELRSALDNPDFPTVIAALRRLASV